MRDSEIQAIRNLDYARRVLLHAMLCAEEPNPASDIRFIDLWNNYKKWGVDAVAGYLDGLQQAENSGNLLQAESALIKVVDFIESAQDTLLAKNSDESFNLVTFNTFVFNIVILGPNMLTDIKTKRIEKYLKSITIDKSKHFLKSNEISSLSLDFFNKTIMEMLKSGQINIDEEEDFDDYEDSDQDIEEYGDFADPIDFVYQTENFDIARQVYYHAVMGQILEELMGEDDEDFKEASSYILLTQRIIDQWKSINRKGKKTSKAQNEKLVNTFEKANRLLCNFLLYIKDDYLDYLDVEESVENGKTCDEIINEKELDNYTIAFESSRLLSIMVPTQEETTILSDLDSLKWNSSSKRWESERIDEICDSMYSLSKHGLDYILKVTTTQHLLAKYFLTRQTIDHKPILEILLRPWQYYCLEDEFSPESTESETPKYVPNIISANPGTYYGLMIKKMFINLPKTGDQLSDEDLYVIARNIFNWKIRSIMTIDQDVKDPVYLITAIITEYPKAFSQGELKRVISEDSGYRRTIKALLDDMVYGLTLYLENCDLKMVDKIISKIMKVVEKYKVDEQLINYTPIIQYAMLRHDSQE